MMHAKVCVLFLIIAGIQSSADQPSTIIVKDQPAVSGKDDGPIAAFGVHFEGTALTEERRDTICEETNFAREKSKSIPLENINGRVNTLRIAQVPTDGNCLFHTLCYLIGAVEGECAEKMRKDLVAYEVETRSAMQHLDSVEMKNKEQEYTDRMKLNGEWGEDREINAAGNYFRINIYVYTLDNIFYGENEESEQQYVLYNPHEGHAFLPEHFPNRPTSDIHRDSVFMGFNGNHYVPIISASYTKAGELIHLKRPSSRISSADVPSKYNKDVFKKVATVHKRISKCQSLVKKFTESHKYPANRCLPQPLESVKQSDNTIRVNALTDRVSFFHVLSKAYTGDEDFIPQALRTLVVNNNMKLLNTIATEEEINTAAIMLHTHIYVYNLPIDNPQSKKAGIEEYITLPNNVKLQKFPYSNSDEINYHNAIFIVNYPKDHYRLITSAFQNRNVIDNSCTTGECIQNNEMDLKQGNASTLPLQLQGQGKIGSKSVQEKPMEDEANFQKAIEDTEETDADFQRAILNSYKKISSNA